MEILIAVVVATLVAGGVYLVLRARTFPVIVGLALFAYAANLVLFASGRLSVGLWPIISAEDKYGLDPMDYPDPLPQALVLTAIVIGFAMTAFVLVLALRAKFDLRSDHVDGELGEVP